MRKVLILVALATAAPACAQTTITPAPGPSVTYVGVEHDVTDFQAKGWGQAGFWFAQFDASGARSGKPTQENERNGLPVWAGPLTHMELWEVWKFPQRTFSQDGPCKSKGGIAAWNYFTLPNGEFGLSGVILDPHGNDNTSQTVNRIMLGPGTPSSFLLRVVVDNTDLKHNPINRIRARGDRNGVSIDPPSFPSPGANAFNGVADVYTFRYDGFGAGDFIKIQFNGMPGGTNNGGSGGSSFAGLMFDPVSGATPTSPSPQPTPSASPSPQPSPSPSPTATGTTAAGATGGGPPPVPTSGSRSGSSCNLGARSAPGGSALLWLVLAAGLALARRRAR